MYRAVRMAETMSAAAPTRISSRSAPRQAVASIHLLENPACDEYALRSQQCMAKAIAIGHPNGASGTRVTWWAMKHLEQTGGRYGCISSCYGGGQGTTAIIENLRR